MVGCTGQVFENGRYAQGSRDGYFRGVKESQALEGCGLPGDSRDNCIAPWAERAYLRAMAEEKRLLNLVGTSEKGFQEDDLEELARGGTDMADNEMGESLYIQASRKGTEACSLLSSTGSN